MRYLLISICFIFFGCVSFPKKNNFKTIAVTSNINNPFFSNPNQDYIYKANIDIYDNTFGGLFIVKKIMDLNLIIFYISLFSLVLTIYLMTRNYVKKNY